MFESFDDLSGLGAFPSFDQWAVNGEELAIKAGGALVAAALAKFGASYVTDAVKMVPVIGGYSEWITPALIGLAGVGVLTYARGSMAPGAMEEQLAEGAGIGLALYGVAGLLVQALTAAGVWDKVKAYNPLNGLGEMDMSVRSYLNGAPMRMESLAAAPQVVERLAGAPVHAESVNGFSPHISTLM